MADTWKTSRVGVKSKNRSTKESAELEKQAAAIAKTIIENAFKKDAPISDDFGKQIAGFISKAAAVKARGTSKKQDPTPAISGASAGNGNENSATYKSVLDALTGSTSASKTVVKKVIASGSLEGVRAANQQGFNLKDADINSIINTAVKSAEAAANDPATQEKFAKIGISPSIVTGLVGELAANASTLTSTNQTTQAVKTQKIAIKNQMKALNQPIGTFELNRKIGSLPIGTPVAPGAQNLLNALSKAGLNFGQVTNENPFGSMGVDYGNIQGSIASLSNGLPVPKELGTNIPVVSGTNNITSAGFASQVEVPNVVTSSGNTNLFETTNKGDLMPNLEPSTPVEEVGVSTGQAVQTFSYTTVHTGKELELEVASATRKITLFITGWTASYTDKRYESAKELNERYIEGRNKKYPGSYYTDQQKSYPAHYVILRDGTIQRVLNVNTPAYLLFKKAETSAQWRFYADNIIDVQKQCLHFFFDAGYTCTKEESDPKFITYKSITPEQWESYNTCIKAVVKAIPGITFRDYSNLRDGWMFEPRANFNVSAVGPGFLSHKYANLIREGETDIEFTTKGDEVLATVAKTPTKSFDGTEEYDG